ncbi:MAG: hypothetical protein HY806_02095 [Nitrospirae bacterium]|nr:hypothetical protein [Nitrospirota bacterium]
MCKRIFKIVIISLMLLALALPAFSKSTGKDGWKKGTITSVNENSVGIGGRRHYVSDSVIIRDISDEVLTKDLKTLKGAEEILYKTDKGEIIEIKIFRRRH